MTIGADYQSSYTLVQMLRNALWACGQADEFAKTPVRRIRPWVDALILAHCLGAIEQLE